MGVNIKKLDEIFTLMDKVNQAAVKGLFPHEGKDAVIAVLQKEVHNTIMAVNGSPKPEKKVEPPAEKKPEPKK